MSFMHFAQTDKGKAEAGQRKVSGAVGTGRAKGASNFLRGRASGTEDAMPGGPPSFGLGRSKAFFLE